MGLLTPGWLSAIPQPGEYQCAACTVAVVAMPGVCDACARKHDEGEHVRSLAFARRTIPERFRWASLEGDAIADRVDPAALLEVRALFGAPIPLGLAILGPAGSGKTSLACAILRRIHDRATFGCPDPILRRAQQSYFVSAVELAADVERARVDRGSSELRRMARNATVLVLDEVSKGGEPAWEIVQLRHDRNVPTIVTSWETPADLGKRHGGGFTRRTLDATIVCRRKGAAKPA